MERCRLAQDQVIRERTGRPLPPRQNPGWRPGTHRPDSCLAVTGCPTLIPTPCLEQISTVARRPPRSNVRSTDAWKAATGRWQGSRNRDRQEREIRDAGIGRTDGTVTIGCVSIVLDLDDSADRTDTAIPTKYKPRASVQGNDLNHVNRDDQKIPDDEPRYAASWHDAINLGLPGTEVHSPLQSGMSG